MKSYMGRWGAPILPVILLFCFSSMAWASSGPAPSFITAIHNVFDLVIPSSLPDGPKGRLRTLFAEEIADMAKGFSPDQFTNAQALLEGIRFKNLDPDRVAQYFVSSGGSQGIELNVFDVGSILLLPAIVHEFRHYVDLWSRHIPAFFSMLAAPVTVIEARAFAQQHRFLERMLQALSTDEKMALVQSKVFLTEPESAWLKDFLSQPAHVLDYSNLPLLLVTGQFPREWEGGDRPLFESVTQKMFSHPSHMFKELIMVLMLSRSLYVTFHLGSYAKRVVPEVGCAAMLIGVAVHEVFSSL